jgi:two-component system, chemotaxis family, response regulator Rcp1
MKKPVRIFIVEDHEPDVYLVQKALRANQVEFVMTRFEDGQQALEEIWKQGPPPFEIPDLVILDLNVPKIDGMEILRAIRKDPNMAKVPIAVLTSSGALHDKVEAIASGADSFITKPVDLKSFVGTVGGSIKDLIDKGRSTAQVV